MRKLFCAMSIIILFCAYGVRAETPDIPERLEYEINWLGIRTGESSLQIKRAEGGRILIVSTAKSADWVTPLYPVDDRVESVLEPELPLRPVSYHRRMNEGSRHKNEEMQFDYEKGRVRYFDRMEGKESFYDIPPVVFDPLSALFKVRGMELGVGKSVYVPLFDSEELYDLEVRVISRERVTVPAGTFDTLLVMPILQSEGIFSREGPIYTWMTNDGRKIPVKIKTKVAIGSITAELSRIVNGTDSMASDNGSGDVNGSGDKVQ